MTEAPKLSAQERIKRESRHLRGNIAADLASDHVAVTEETYELLKFHGTYEGYNRDTATQRKKAGLEKEYEFMVRLKIPAGRLKAEQYLALDGMADSYSNGTLRITTRETFQFHCVAKGNLKKTIAAINRALLSTLGGCGDVVRNLTACPAPIKDLAHEVMEESALTLARYMAPKGGAYHEIWLDGERVDPAAESDSMYGETYLPRKFKIGIAEPTDNCIDVLTHDLAILPMFKDGKLAGYNFALGGGMGMTHNNPKTFPRLASPIAFVQPDDLVPAADAVVRLQRDHGDRVDRKHARLKYVVEEKGIPWTRQTLEHYFGAKLEDPWGMPKWGVEDHTGWHAQGDGKWFLGVPVSSGRIVDRGEERIRTGLREVIRTYKMNLTLTADQNIILCDIEEGEKQPIERMLRAHGVKLTEDITPAYRHFLACVALPTCGKALAEAERVKLPLVDNLEKALDAHGLLRENITIRMTGCPHGCARPYVGDIGIVGRMPDHYALYVGGDFEGTRLSDKLFDKVPFENIVEALDPLFALYREGKKTDEGFGDFCHRYGIEKLRQAAIDTLQQKYKWAN